MRHLFIALVCALSLVLVSAAREARAGSVGQGVLIGLGAAAVMGAMVGAASARQHRLNPPRVSSGKRSSSKRTTQSSSRKTRSTSKRKAEPSEVARAPQTAPDRAVSAEDEVFRNRPRVEPASRPEASFVRSTSRSGGAAPAQLPGGMVTGPVE